MKKVVLLGDSIRLIGYGPFVPELLGEDFTVWQPEDNCRFASYTLRMLCDHKNDMEGADIIHWNNGLWDVCDLFGDGAFTPIDTYVEQLTRIATILKTYAPTVIFATTTVPAPAMWGHSRDRIAAYNEAAIAALRPMGILINDIFPLVDGHTDTMICEDLLHLTEDASRIIARQVADTIRRAAE